MDKLAHFFAGGFIAAVVLPFGAAYAVLAAAIAGMAKELRDQAVDPVDFLATIAGGVVIVAWVTAWT